MHRGNSGEQRASTERERGERETRDCGSAPVSGGVPASEGCELRTQAAAEATEGWKISAMRQLVGSNRMRVPHARCGGVVAASAVAAVVLAAVVGQVQAEAKAGFVVEPAALSRSPYDAHAHGHWVWLHADSDDQESVVELVDNYTARDIPVGGVDLDSGWSVKYNDFVVDTEKFPNFAAMVEHFHAQGIWVILWATSMVNVDDPNFAVGVENGYFLRNSKGHVRPMKWWHGYGALVDYTNPAAVDWWHGLLDNVLDVGVDGWKLDGTNPYMLEYTLGGGALGYEDQPVNYRSYANDYYRDFYYYAKEKRGEALIWARPIDCLLDLDIPPDLRDEIHTKDELMARVKDSVEEEDMIVVDDSLVCIRYSPMDVMMSGWVGDQDSDWAGLQAALQRMIYSAWFNYAGYGSDIGGYRHDSSELGRDRTTFIRWFQMGAFVPLMENGGGGEHRPWMFDEDGSTETTDIYRKFVKEHLTLSPYLMTAGTLALEKHSSVIHPVAQPPDDSTLPFAKPPSTYTYFLGNDILVFPITQDVNGWERMEFPTEDPKGNSVDQWICWWEPNKGQFDAGSTATRKYELDSFPVFARKGALLPLHNTGLNIGGLVELDTHVTFTAYGLNDGQEESCDVHEQDTAGLQASYTFDASAGTAQFSISAYPAPVSVRIIGVDSFDSVNLQASPEAQVLYHLDKRNHELRIVVSDASLGAIVDVAGLSMNF